MTRGQSLPSRRQGGSCTIRRTVHYLQLRSIWLGQQMASGRKGQKSGNVLRSSSCDAVDVLDGLLREYVRVCDPCTNGTLLKERRVPGRGDAHTCVHVVIPLQEREQINHPRHCAVLFHHLIFPLHRTYHTSMCLD